MHINLSNDMWICHQLKAGRAQMERIRHFSETNKRRSRRSMKAVFQHSLSLLFLLTPSTQAQTFSFCELEKRTRWIAFPRQISAAGADNTCLHSRSTAFNISIYLFLPWVCFIYRGKNVFFGRAQHIKECLITERARIRPTVDVCTAHCSFLWKCTLKRKHAHVYT